MNRPGVLLTLFYISGVILGRYFVSANTALLIGLLTLLIIAAFFLCKKTGRFEWFIILPFLVLGIFTVNQQNLGFYGLEGENVAVEGVVADVYETEYGLKIITVNASEIKTDEETLKYNKKISVRMREPVDLLCGQAITAYGKAEEPDFERNPGGFSESRYMLSRGIGGKLSADKIEPGKMERLGLYIIQEKADNVSKAFSEALPPDIAGIISAIVLGDKDGITAEIYESFQRAGISHILAISGLHLSLLSLILFKCFRFAGFRIRGRALATVVVLWAYCAFTGFSASSLRACIMTTVIMFGYVLYRGADIFSSLAIAALIILLGRPFFLWDAGFLLSFSAVLGIGFLTPVIRPWLKFMDFKGISLSKYMAVTIAATVATFPVCAYFFFSVSIAGLITNLLIVPFAGILVAVGALFAVLAAFFSSGILASVIFTLLRYVIVNADFFGKLPLSYITVGRPELYNIALYYAIVIIAGIYVKKSGEGNMVLAKRLKIAGAFIVMIFAALNISRLLPENKLEITFLDVKQGDASVLHLPDNINIIIDAGGKILQGIGQNTGAKVVFPYLKYRGIRKIDAVFLTHPDFDHAAGVIELLGLIKVNRLFISDVKMENAVLDMVLETAEREGVPVTRIKSGYGAEIGETRIECVYPLSSGAPKDINNASLTLKITHGESTFLFTGDIERGDEEKILLSGAEIKCDVLKVPHHGSKTSSTAGFVSAVSPEAALVGSGINNSFGHPSPEVVSNYEAVGAKLLNTADEGAIMLSTDGRVVKLKTMREEAGNWRN